MADVYKATDYGAAKKTLELLGRWLAMDHERSAHSLA